jgi:hypothetical protein
MTAEMLLEIGPFGLTQKGWDWTIARRCDSDALGMIGGAAPDGLSAAIRPEARAHFRRRHWQQESLDQTPSSRQR